MPRRAAPPRPGTLTSCSRVSAELVSAHEAHGSLVVTFTNRQAQDFALNWARQLHTIGVPSLVGTSDDLGRETIAEFRRTRAGLFCADGDQMLRNGQAGRWIELLPLLEYGLGVMVSDSDIGWFRSPISYFASVRRAHPHVDLLLCSDYVGNGYSTKPLRGGADGDLDLDGWPQAKVSSINIGVLYAYPHANRSVGALIRAWSAAVVESSERGGLAQWDQGPINQRVLRPGLNAHAADASLAVVGRGRAHEAALGILPMLQFSTAFTYFIHAVMRARAGAAAFSLHAIFSHGKSFERKVQILREAQLWHDPPSYYAEGRYLQLAPDEEEPAAQAARHPDDAAAGGVGLMTRQLARFYQGVRLARLLNRTLVLPRVRCGDAPMAYPCYGWYHRAMTKDAKFNSLKVPMPEWCPSYYWLSLGMDPAKNNGVAWRDAGFLTHPDAPRSRSGSGSGGGVGEAGRTAVMRVCSAGGDDAAAGDCVRADAPAAALRKAARRVGDATRVLVVRGAAELRGGPPPAESVGVGGAAGGHGATAGGYGATALSAAWGGMSAPPTNLTVRWLLRGPLRSMTMLGWWCSACAVTGAVAPLEAVFGRSGEEGVAQLQQFCAAEARGRGRGVRAVCARHARAPPAAQHVRPKDGDLALWRLALDDGGAEAVRRRGARRLAVHGRAHLPLTRLWLQDVRAQEGRHRGARQAEALAAPRCGDAGVGQGQGHRRGRQRRPRGSPSGGGRPERAAVESALASGWVSRYDYMSLNKVHFRIFM